jgi:hypothetical protein
MKEVIEKHRQYGYSLQELDRPIFHTKTGAITTQLRVYAININEPFGAQTFCTPANWFMI